MRSRRKRSSAKIYFEQVKRRSSACRGAALVELALILPLLLLVIGGIWDYSDMVRQSTLILLATRNGARNAGATAGATAWCGRPSSSTSCRCDDSECLNDSDPVLKTSLTTTCAFLANAGAYGASGLRPSDWLVTSNSEPYAIEVPDSTALNRREVTVSVSPSVSSSKRCLLCWLPALRSTYLRAQSTFSLQVRCG